MPRDIPVGNGRMLVTFDKDGLIRDLYYPHVGQENHTRETPCRFGVWVNGRFSWVPDGWSVKRDYLDDSLVTDVELVNEGLKLRIRVNDTVDFHVDVYVKRIVVENLSDEEMDARVFLTHEFQIYGIDIGDTAAYRPEANGLLHYKGERYFLVNVCANGRCGVEHFATGDVVPGRLEGTWKDAEDGVLSGNPVAQGSVDSAVGIHLRIAPHSSEECWYWICAGKDWNEADRLNSAVVKKTPGHIMKRTLDYWRLWAAKEELNFSLLPEKLGRQYRRSLLITRTNIDECGSIIAANDSDVVHFNRDTYSYMWPRDGALVCAALDLAGFEEITRRFFNLCGNIIERDGYFLHKYTPSGALASSWHPWYKEGKSQIPFQEDETALVVWALWRHFDRYRDIEFIKPLYRPVIKNAADMMMNYRDSKTKLPLPSYDLWEERQGIHTWTVSAVHGGLTAAANFAEVFGEKELAAKYKEGAREVREAMDSYLYMEPERRFARMINFLEDGTVAADKTLDASLIGMFTFGAYPLDDMRVKGTMEQVYDRLWCKTPVGGLARYEGDGFYRVSKDVPGNPWFVTTLWLAHYYIALAKTKEELARALEVMGWVADRALPSGVLAEQLDPYTDEPLSVSPLTWSHAAFIFCVHEYLEKLIEVERCPACGQPMHSIKTRKNP